MGCLLRLPKVAYTVLALFLQISGSIAQHFGEADHPMNKHTDNRDILEYWRNTDKLAVSVYSAAYGHLSADPTATYARLMHDDEFQAVCAEAEIRILGGPMLGRARPDGVSVWVRTLKPSRVEVEINSHGFRKTFGPVQSTLETDLLAIIEISDLQPATTYNYQLRIDNQLIDKETRYSFRTPPAESDEVSTRIAFGSCSHRWGLGNEQLFNQIMARKPDAMLFLGDIAVQDRNDHLGLHRADYLLRDFFPAWKRFSASVPVYASWDDHDYFDDDQAGIPKGFTNADREGVWQVFKNSWNNPSYGFGEKGKGLFTHTRIGAFDIIMTDNRYFRAAEKGTFLGDEQMDWLKKQLLDCDAPFIILSCGSMWSDFVSDGKDSWGANDPDGREELLEFIEEQGIKGVLLISGDRHGARGFTIPRDSGYEFYEFEAASLGGRVGPPATDPAWDTQLYGVDGTFAFGEFTSVPSDLEPAVRYRLVRQDGVVLYEILLKRSQLTPILNGGN